MCTRLTFSFIVVGIVLLLECTGLGTNSSTRILENNNTYGKLIVNCSICSSSLSSLNESTGSLNRSYNDISDQDNGIYVIVR